jgi:glycosyltransferase involved in cell wall biosynthesis
MRIAHLVGASGLNGVATSCVTLAREQVRAGHDVMLVLPDNSWIGGQVFDPAVHVLRTSYKTKPSEIRRVGDAIRAWKAHVVHCHGSRANKYGMVYRLSVGAPVVMTAHTRQLQLPWPAAHVVIAPSAETADYYHRRLLARRSATRIVPNAFTVDNVPVVTVESRVAARSMLGLDQDAFVIGAVGHLEERKNQAGMQRIARRLAQSGVTVRLLLVGQLMGDASEQERAIVQDLEKDPLVLLAGAREDVPAILPAFDAFMMMSSREEAPIAPLEAMARAIPTVSYVVGNMADITPPELLFAQGDEDGVFQRLMQLAGDHELARRMGTACRAMVSAKLSPSAILPQIEDAYRDAISRSRFPDMLTPAA